MFGGGPRSAANPGGGLPFAGVPSEMQAGIDKLVVSEPEHPEPDVSFTYKGSAPGSERLTLRGLLFRHWQLGLLAVFYVAIVSVVNQAGPQLIGIGIDRGIEGRGGMHVIVVVSILYLLAILITAAAQRSQARVTGRLAAWVMNDLRVKIFAKLQQLGLDFFTEEKAGVIMTRMTSDIENLQQLLQDGLASFAVQGLTMVVVTILLFTKNVELTLISLGIVVPPLVVLSLWFRNASENAYNKVRDGIANVLADLAENLHGIRVVVALNRQRRNVVHHRNVVGDYRRANDRTAQITATYTVGSQLLGYLSQAILLAIGGDMVVHHHLSAGDLTAFFLYLNRFFAPIQLLVQQYNTYQQGRASITKLQSVLDETPNVVEESDAVELPPITGAIDFEHVSFGYDPEIPVIRDVTISIRPGETVAFVGATGAGKSTMAKLVTRFYDPTSGTVRIDGFDLRQLAVDSLRRQLGVVPQEPFLFAGTLRDNIAFACPTASEEQVAEAIRVVGLEELVGRLPRGLETVVHERGQTLSSGERQLIALARAFLAHPRVLVLDEATSNLDLKSEGLVEQALDHLLEGRTAILIAHRLTTAMKADRIVVVHEGRVAEVGSHAELVEAGGLYADMFETWMSHQEAA